jgi:predicted metalloendopeptidase
MMVVKNFVQASTENKQITKLTSKNEIGIEAPIEEQENEVLEIKEQDASKNLSRSHRIQTAEGWKREQLRRRLEKRKV